MAYSNKENIIPEDKKGYIGKLLSPVNIGHVILNYDSLKKGKYKYNLENNGVIEPNSFILIDGGKDVINNINLKNIQGKDYSVGCNSYIIKQLIKNLLRRREITLIFQMKLKTNILMYVLMMKLKIIFCLDLMKIWMKMIL
jgi:hypothetical protein